MEYTIKETDTAKILEIRGELNIASEPQFESLLLSFLEEEHKDLILDFKEVTYISSSGLRALVTGAKKIKEKNKKLTLIHVSPTVQKILKMSGFDKFLDIQPYRV